MPSEELRAISQAIYDFAEDERQRRADERYKAGQFVSIADASECLWLIGELIDRVSSITGEASKLEDAACELTQFIDNQEPALCATCNGSGEGMTESTRCMVCKGSGTDKGEQS